MRVRRDLAAELDRVAFAEGALVARGVGHVEIGTGYEDVRLAIGEHALNAAGCCVRLGIRVGGLVVFEGNLLLHLVGDQLFHVGRKRRGIGHGGG